MTLGILTKLVSFFRRPPALQVAALCYRIRSGGPEVLLVKSLGRGRWIIPKGWPMNGKSLAEAAAIEAWEEAGVTGVVNQTSVGIYHYNKLQGGGLKQRSRVHVFEIAVEDLAEVYPESDKRVRFWMTPAEAAQKVDELELKAILSAFAERQNSSAL